MYIAWRGVVGQIALLKCTLGGWVASNHNWRLPPGSLADKRVNSNECSINILFIIYQLRESYLRFTVYTIL